MTRTIRVVSRQLSVASVANCQCLPNAFAGATASALTRSDNPNYYTMGRENQLLTRGLGLVTDITDLRIVHTPRNPFKARRFDQAPIKRRRHPALAHLML